MTEPESIFIWDAFTHLNGSRGASMGGAMPIPISEINAYAAYQGVTSPRLRRRLLNGIRAMDRAYMDWMSQHRG